MKCCPGSGPVVGVLDELYSTKPAHQSSYQATKNYKIMKLCSGSGLSSFPGAAWTGVALLSVD
jgi:hypothetical protein